MEPKRQRYAYLHFPLTVYKGNKKPSSRPTRPSPTAISQTALDCNQSQEHHDRHETYKNDKNDRNSEGLEWALHLISNHTNRDSWLPPIHLVMRAVLSLPFELRAKIYEEVLYSASPLPLFNNPSDSKCPGTKIITYPRFVGFHDAELCRKAYYEQNVFKCNEYTLMYHRSAIPTGHRAFLKRLELHMSNSRLRTPVDAVNLKTTLLAYPHLKQLALVAQPTESLSRTRNFKTPFVPLKHLIVELTDVLGESTQVKSGTDGFFSLFRVSPTQKDIGLLVKPLRAHEARFMSLWDQFNQS